MCFNNLNQLSMRRSIVYTSMIAFRRFPPFFHAVRMPLVLNVSPVPIISATHIKRLRSLGEHDLDTEKSSPLKDSSIKTERLCSWLGFITIHKTVQHWATCLLGPQGWFQTRCIEVISGMSAWSSVTNKLISMTWLAEALFLHMSIRVPPFDCEHLEGDCAMD